MLWHYSGSSLDAMTEYPRGFQKQWRRSSKSGLDFVLSRMVWNGWTMSVACNSDWCMFIYTQRRRAENGKKSHHSFFRCKCYICRSLTFLLDQWLLSMYNTVTEDYYRLQIAMAVLDCFIWFWQMRLKQAWKTSQRFLKLFLCELIFKTCHYRDSRTNAETKQSTNLHS